MISQEIAQSAIQIAEEFDRRGLRIVTHPDAPLATLVAASSVALVASQSVATPAEDLNRAYEPAAAAIAADSSIASVISPDSSVHDQELDAAVTDIAEAVSSHLSFAKNTVKPLVKELATSVAAALAAYPESATFNPSVVKIDLPQPMLNPAMEEAISEYRENTYVPVTMHMNLPPQDAASVIENLKTGSASADGDIAVWVGKLGEDFFRKVWSTIFTNEIVETVVNFDTLVADKLNGSDYALAVYLLSKRLMDSPPADSGYSLPQYRKEMGELLEQSAIRLSHAYEKRALDIKTQLLILSYTNENVYVVAPVYEDWMAAGGNNAVLFGNILSDRPALFVPALAEKSVEYLDMWERQNRMLTTTVVNRRFVEAKSTLKFKAQELIANNIEACFGGYASEQVLTFHTPEVVLAVEKISSYVDALEQEDLKDIWKVCTELVAKNIFYYTDSYKILLGIEQACKDNPGIDVSEAALLSTIEYVTDYVADQLVVVEL